MNAATLKARAEALADLETLAHQRNALELHLRAAVVKADRVGVEKTVIADTIGIHRSTVYEWLKETS